MTDITTEDMPDRIGESFNHQEILITGGTGFIGKVLIEKLLRLTPKFGKIYAIVRARKGKSSQQRLDDVFQSPLFDKLRRERDFPALRKSVIAINGDASLPNLDLAEEDRKMLCERVNIVYHAAATVRFDELLKTTVFLNTRSTRDLLELAKEMKQLKLFVYVSTAYSQIKDKVVSDKIYSPPADPHKIIRCMERVPDNVVEAMTLKILGNYPNPYSFTKALSEGLVAQAMEHIPAIIIRPSIVVPIWKDPLPGWADNMNGPIGLLIGAGKGVIRAMYCNEDGYADLVPVDLIVSSLMVTTWSCIYQNNPARVFNITNSHEFKITWKEVIALGQKVVHEFPLDQMIWRPDGVVTDSRIYYNICVIFFHLIPAFVIDTLIYLAGYKPVMFRAHCRINKGFRIFDYYTNKLWLFEKANLQKVRSSLNAKENQIYTLRAENVDRMGFFQNSLIGAKLYILHEKLENLPAARRLLKIMVCLDYITKTLFFGYVAYLLFYLCESLMSSLTSTWAINTTALQF